MRMPSLADKVLQRVRTLLADTPVEAAGVRLGSDAWTLKEIVGHLLDSATNNQQRFVRLTFGDLAAFPGYDAEPWVRAQRWDELEWDFLKGHWLCCNELLVHVIGALPESAASHCWHTPDGPLSLEYLVEDYYRHMESHADHFAGRLAEIRQAMGR